MIWSILIISFGFASARIIENVGPEYLESLRSSGQDEEFARLLGVDVSLVRQPSDERSEGSIFNFVSSLGDIVLPEEKERQGINFTRYPGSKWSDGKIPYNISVSDFTEEQIEYIEKAIRDFNSRVSGGEEGQGTSCIELVPYTGQKDYVQVISGQGCWSYLGRREGQQPLSLQRNGCLNFGTIQHEFMHAAGYHHEHCRADRDEHCTVLWDNIPENWHSQYERIPEDVFPCIIGYDFDSVMHYPIWAPVTRKDAFKIPDHVDRDRLGQRNGLSPMDVQKLNYWYC